MSQTERVQREICDRVGSSYVRSDENLNVGLALSTLDQNPIYGVRLSPAAGTTGWFIWAGPHSEDPHFYQSVHSVHLKELCPLVVKYLGLAPGYKFIIDRVGYEDVWFEPLPNQEDMG